MFSLYYFLYITLYSFRKKRVRWLTQGFWLKTTKLNVKDETDRWAGRTLVTMGNTSSELWQHFRHLDDVTGGGGARRDHMTCFWIPGVNSLALGFRLLFIWRTEGQ